jgi:membrane-bound lytic murein transglycosylase A
MTGCAEIPTDRKTEPKLVLKSASFSDVPGWNADAQDAALVAFARSCARILKQSPEKPFGPDSWAGTYGDWQSACRVLPNSEMATPEDARTYFEEWFIPVAATADGNPEGLFTGYYEASLRGALKQEGLYQIPLRARPADLVMVNLGEFRDELRGTRIAGRVKDGYLKPYEDRADIEDGKLPKDMDVSLLWTDSAIDAFYLQIQGSGVVTLTDGSERRVGFDGQNGHVYSAIGKELIARGHLTKGNVSMQSIRSWLEANPVEGRDIMRTNKSYVFFRFTDNDVEKNGGPLGGEGISLTPERSLAVDRSLIPYGIPVFLDAENPNPDHPRLQQLMVAQDTGGAIRGPVRGDVFWGHGDAAEKAAGPMKSRGRYWFLLPKSLGR